MALLSARKLKELRETATKGNRVALAIDLADVRQLEVSEGTGLPQPYISDVARDRYQTITVENARKFADYFGCQIEDLFPSRDEAVSA